MSAIDEAAKTSAATSPFFILAVGSTIALVAVAAIVALVS